MGKGKKKRGKQTPQAQSAAINSKDDGENVASTTDVTQEVQVASVSDKLSQAKLSDTSSGDLARNEEKEIVPEKSASGSGEHATSCQPVVRKKEPIQESDVTTVKSSKPQVTVVQGLGGMVGKAARQYQIPRVADLTKKRQIVAKSGHPIMVQANHFHLNIRMPKGEVYHYDLQFKYPFKRDVRKADRPFLIIVIEAFKKKYEKTFGNPSSIVHDGFKNLFAARQLDFPSVSFEGNVAVPKIDDPKTEVNMSVKVKYVGSVNVQDAIEEYSRRGTTVEKPNDAVQVLNIILGMTPQLHYVTLGRSYFNLEKGSGGVIDLGGGKSLWIGTFTSVRLGWKPMLNVDMANKPAYEQAPVIEFVGKVLAPPMRGGFGQQRGGSHTPQRGSPPIREIKDKRDFQKVDNELKQLKIRFTRPDGQKREYRVNKLMEPASRLKMKLDNGQIITIQEYFLQQYKFQLKFPNLPCLHVGDPKKTIYLPMELCELKKQAAPRSKILGEEEAANMIRKTAVPPSERKKRIYDNMREMDFGSDKYAKSFGLSIGKEMATIRARILDRPSLKYKKADKDVEFKLREGGKWNMGSERDREKFQFLAGTQLNNWGILDLAMLRDQEKSRFVDALYQEGTSRGFDIGFPIYASGNEQNTDDAEKKFIAMYQQLKLAGPPQLIMVLVSRKTNVRSRIKVVGDSTYKIPTQFVMKRNVLGKNGPSPQTMHNICLKLNAKLQGVNQALHSVPKIMQVPVMIMGADVTHPSPGDFGKKPSIAAVVASCDPKASKYNCEVRLQSESQVVEIIKQLEEVTRKLLIKFKEKVEQPPQKIIFYRDGVSEGQFEEVLNCEMSAMRRACSSLNPSYKPGITFIVAQKRHKTRLFPCDERDGVGKPRNVPPGTVVDTDITHPTEKDFFLASHEGIQGTTKPTHYHLLWDDSNLSMDDLENLTYQLCHLYARCERSVSYPAPTYYAHLAAFRAREHHNALLDKYIGKNIPTEELDRIEQLDLINYFI